MIDTQTINLGQGIIVMVNIDTTAIDKLESKAKQLQESLTTVLQELGDEVKSIWQRNAETRLKDYGGYVDAIEQGSSFNAGEMEYSIVPNFKKGHDNKDVGILMEYGFDAFDMKAKIAGKKIINFEFGLPGSSNLNVLSDEMYNIALKNNMFLDYPMTPRTVPEMFSGDYADKYNPQKTKSISVSDKMQSRFPNTKLTLPAQALRYKWKERQFTRMRASKTTVKLSTFRTISSIPPKSESAKLRWANSWLHPGVVPKNIFRDTVSEMSGKIKPKIKKAIEQVLGK